MVAANAAVILVSLTGPSLLPPELCSAALGATQPCPEPDAPIPCPLWQQSSGTKGKRYSMEHTRIMLAQPFGAPAAGLLCVYGGQGGGLGVYSLWPGSCVLRAYLL